MNTKTPVLTPEMIDYWKRKINRDTGKPYTQREIAKMYGVTPSYVSWVKRTKTNNFMRTARETAMEHYPWKTTAAVNGCALDRLVRDHIEYMSTGGKGMSRDKLQRLSWFYRRIDNENLVVEYDPEIPPNEDSSLGGFTYRERLVSDGDLIIRVNEHTNLTEDNMTLLELPPERPKLR